MASALIDTFLASLAKAYAELNPAGLADLATPVAPGGAEREAQRAYALVDLAAREWVRWALDAPPDELGQVPAVRDQASADEAEGWLSAACKQLGSFERIVVGAARAAAENAARMEVDLPGFDNAEEIAAVATAAGRALAAAGWMRHDPEETEARAGEAVARLAAIM